jgi:hypothetical protein
MHKRNSKDTANFTRLGPDVNGKETPEEKNKRIHRNLWRGVIVAIILALLLTAGLITVAIVAFNAINGSAADVVVLTNAIAQQVTINMQVNEALMHTGGLNITTTLIQNGTFLWNMNGNLLFEQPPMCGGSYVQYATNWCASGLVPTVPSTYTVNLVQVGDVLSFQQLVLSPPTQTTTIDNFPYEFDMFNFQPPLANLFGLSTYNSKFNLYILPLTSYNLAKFHVSNGCVEAKTCFLTAFPGGDAQTPNSLSATTNFNTMPNSFQLSGSMYGPGGTLVGSPTFSLTSALELELPAS